MENLKALIQGLKANLEDLRTKEKLFIKANTLKEQEETARLDATKLEGRAEYLKDLKNALKVKRAEILAGALGPIADTISVLLPRGKAVLTLDDDLFIGWKEGERLIPYGGLSGGEKVMFDAALSNALLKGNGHKVLIYEAAELDDTNLEGTLNAITKTNPGAQIIVNTCHKPAKLPEGWKGVELK